ncbi:MAG: hypothetical protein RLN76_10835 [Phycisphaeraceae bacterium]
MNAGRGFVLATAALMAASVAAEAATVSLSRTSFSGKAVRISTDSGASYTSLTGGRFTWNGGGALGGLESAGDLITFCIEAFETVGNSATYSVVDIWDAPKDNGGPPNPSPMGVARATLLTKLANVAIDDFGASIGSWGFDQIVPFQMAIWEIVNETTTGLGSLSLTDGSFRAQLRSADAGEPWLTDAQSLLADAIAFTGVMDYSLGGLSSPDPNVPLTANKQDQMYFMDSPPPPPIIPTPTAAFAGLLGLAGLLARRQA